MATKGLKGRRDALERARNTWTEQGSADGVSEDIVDSWGRSSGHVPESVTEAPMDDPDRTRAEFEASPLHVAVGQLETELRRVAEDGDLVVAVTDSDTRLLWTYGGRVMRRKAERVNFVPGGRWDETSVGTNALSLAQQTGRTQTVFSAEHYAPIVHNWVCWAAPVRDLATGEQIGVLDLSTTWDRSHPIGAATATALASLVEREIPRTALSESAAHVGHGLTLRVLGAAEAHLDGVRLLLTKRQSEILALLALHPEGLGLDALHAALYGDARVSTSTLKAEVSHLRQALGGRLASRPYRLDLPVTCDAVEVMRAVRSRDVDGAVTAYGGDLMPGTDSPELTSTGDYLAVAVRESLLADPRPDVVVRYARNVPYDTEVVERALAALGAQPHPARAELTAILSANH
ncbi:histidine kinase [Knoellia subterranea]|uniref:Transcriptional regulator n=1 Tax=Knoellia subterranea KCTC 19937 TaxID=1385521 RepID=A0A0A0JRI0_9MICO|nr:histidine kinase [Knoellia subterranea]KGN38206.1 transcriptional regulator [Knoellia subterranea KCTC 19937]